MAYSEIQSNQDLNIPQFYIEQIDSTGKVSIKFTHRLMVPKNLTDFEASGFLIEMVPAIKARKQYLDFTWELTQFKEEGC